MENTISARADRLAAIIKALEVIFQEHNVSNGDLMSSCLDCHVRGGDSLKWWLRYVIAQDRMREALLTLRGEAIQCLHACHITGLSSVPEIDEFAQQPILGKEPPIKGFWAGTLRFLREEGLDTDSFLKEFKRRMVNAGHRDSCHLFKTGWMIAWIMENLP